MSNQIDDGILYTGGDEFAPARKASAEDAEETALRKLDKMGLWVGMPNLDTATNEELTDLMAVASDLPGLITMRIAPEGVRYAISSYRVVDDLLRYAEARLEVRELSRQGYVAQAMNIDQRCIRIFARLPLWARWRSEV